MTNHCDKNVDTDWDIHFDENGNCEKENDEKELKSFKKLMPYL